MNPETTSERRAREALEVFLKRIGLPELTAGTHRIRDVSVDVSHHQTLELRDGSLQERDDQRRRDRSLSCYFKIEPIPKPGDVVYDVEAYLRYHTSAEKPALAADIASATGHDIDGVIDALMKKLPTVSSVNERTFEVTVRKDGNREEREIFDPLKRMWTLRCFVVNLPTATSRMLTRWALTFRKAAFRHEGFADQHDEAAADPDEDAVYCTMAAKADRMRAQLELEIERMFLDEAAKHGGAIPYPDDAWQDIDAWVEKLGLDDDDDEEEPSE